MKQVSSPQIETWVTNYKRNKTQKAALNALRSLNYYLDDIGASNTDWISTFNESDDAKYHKLNEYVKWLDLMPASVRQYFVFIKSYIRVVYGIKLDLADQKQLIKFDKIAKIERAPLSKEVIKMLCQNSNSVYKAFFLIQSSSGMRASESINLKKENFDFKSDPCMITIPAALTKTQSDRITFISKEAKAVLLDNKAAYFQERSLDTIESYFWKLRQKLNLKEKYNGTPNYKVNIHSFRAFFRTQAGKINQDFAESILGHEGYLKQYVRLTPAEKSWYYQKVEPKLKIF